MITKEEIQNIAMLARLSVKEEEYPAVLRDLQQMTDFADIVRLADISGCEQDVQRHNEGFFAEDEVAPSCCREEILANAPLSDGEFFLVRKRA